MPSSLFLIFDRIVLESTKSDANLVEIRKKITLINEFDRNILC